MLAQDVVVNESVDRLNKGLDIFLETYNIQG